MAKNTVKDIVKRELRRRWSAKELSDSSLARETGLSRSFINEFRHHDAVDIRSDHLELIANAMGLSIRVDKCG